MIALVQHAIARVIERLGPDVSVSEAVVPPKVYDAILDALSRFPDKERVGWLPTIDMRFRGQHINVIRDPVEDGRNRITITIECNL